MSEIEVTEELLAGLAGKLESLHLTDEESAVLFSVLWTAAEEAGDEVAGFSMGGQPGGGPGSLTDLLRTAAGPRVPLGGLGIGRADPGGVSGSASPNSG